jgi:lactoylglutathione lyase
MPSVSQVVPLLNVADMQRSLRFYVEQLGFEMKNKWIDGGKLRWCWLEIGGAALMLQEHTPEGKAGVGVSLNFICDDAIAFYHQFVAKGVEAKRPSVGNGMWVTKIVDPDGYLLYFESTTDAEEDSVYE